MRINCLKLLLLALCLCALPSCMIVIRDQSPRWEYSLKCNGKTDKFKCIEDTYPKSMEYSVPEFFIKEDRDKVVFRFYYKHIGYKLQFATTGPFQYGKRYEFNEGDEFFDVTFRWLYNGVEYKCRNGWIEFKKGSALLREAYSIKYEFDLTAPGSDKLEIRNGTFTVYDKVEPRNTDLGLTK